MSLHKEINLELDICEHFARTAGRTRKATREPTIGRVRCSLPTYYSTAQLASTTDPNLAYDLRAK